MYSKPIFSEVFEYLQKGNPTAVYMLRNKTFSWDQMVPLNKYYM